MHYFSPANPFKKYATNSPQHLAKFDSSSETASDRVLHDRFKSRTT